MKSAGRVRFDAYSRHGSCPIDVDGGSVREFRFEIPLPYSISLSMGFVDAG